MIVLSRILLVAQNVFLFNFFFKKINFCPYIKEEDLVVEFHVIITKEDYTPINEFFI